MLGHNLSQCLSFGYLEPIMLIRRGLVTVSEAIGDNTVTAFSTHGSTHSHRPVRTAGKNKSEARPEIEIRNNIRIVVNSVVDRYKILKNSFYVRAGGAVSESYLGGQQAKWGGGSTSQVGREASHPQLV
ncbi:hypothetical protein EVAR_43761_1 [Eumeta japonica]|uniref:Uncharacterized protein n=1 Tax=Eumeta variegata TaxID=151549 RepID=A0A4C1XIL5_EUMVA|nr:hypothetical protein EVAR_43761_1 [Eumeta japonica]